VKFTLIKLEKFSGRAASVYDVKMDGDNLTLFEQFVLENRSEYLSEIKDIVQRLHVIGHNYGARQEYFKEFEGKPGDGLCALYDLPDNHLRLYCIRNGKVNVILGGGGPKKVRALQDDKKLTEENYLLRKVSAMIVAALKEGDTEWSDDGMDLMGDLTFDDYEDEA
jgi:hypothetical protein